MQDPASFLGLAQVKRVKKISPRPNAATAQHKVFVPVVCNNTKEIQNVCIMNRFPKVTENSTWCSMGFSKCLVK